MFACCFRLVSVLLVISVGDCLHQAPRPISLDYVSHHNLTISPYSVPDEEMRDYTNHTVVRILEKDMPHFLGNGNGINDHEHEVLWYDTSSHNTSYAFVRLSPEASHRVKRDAGNARFVTHNLQAWIDAQSSSSRRGSHVTPTTVMMTTDVRNNQVYPRKAASLPPYVSSSEIDEEEEEEEVPPCRGRECMQGSSNVERHYSRIAPSTVLNEYHPLERVHHFLLQVEKATPGVTTFSIGKTHEGRDILAMEIMNNPRDNRFIWVDGCTHAREWVTVTTIMYMIEQIIIEKLPINIILVPVLNVDGYVYTWNKDRLWRKNRRPYQASRLTRFNMPERCTGVDLNRNYDINFGGEGSSNNPCSLLYQGPAPFSEPEVKAASDILSRHRDRIHMTLSLHSFNQLWACPNAYTKVSTPDYEHHMSVLRAVKRAVYNTNHADYDIGPLGQRLYLGSGFMLDWIYHKLGIRDAYLVELRDKGHYGFILPLDQVWPTATETWNGFKAAVKIVFKL